jgi:hypothetical protein
MNFMKIEQLTETTWNKSSKKWKEESKSQQLRKGVV